MRVWGDCRCGRHPAAHTEMHDDPWSSRRTVRAVVLCDCGRRLAFTFEISEDGE